MSSHFSGNEMDIQCNREGKYKIKVYRRKTQASKEATSLTPVLSFMPSSKSRADQGLSLRQEFPKKATAVSSE